jgi:hypothetical protein
MFVRNDNDFLAHFFIWLTKFRTFMVTNHLEEFFMKKLILISFCAAITFALYSCDRKTLAPSTGISATIDGKAETFNTIDSASSRTATNQYIMSINARNSAADSADVLELFLDSPTPIAVGTYSLTPGSYNPPYVPLIVYKVKGSTNFANDYVIDYTGAHQISITVTSISSTNIQGTFSGTLVVAAGSSGATKTITDGKFNVDVK